MNLLYVITICVWTSVSMATKQQLATDEVLASSEVIQQLLARVEKVEKHGEEQEKEIQILKSAMIQQQQDMEKLRSELQAKDQIIETLMIHASSQTDDDLKSTNDDILTDSLKTDGPNETEDVRQVRDGKNRIRQLENEATIAFSAGLSQHMTQVGAQQNIIFDKLITNIGNAYNPHHGVFIAPVAGVYMFHVHVLSYDGQNSWAFMAVNGTNKASIYMHESIHGAASQSLIVQLNKGDDVAIHGRAGSQYFGDTVPYTVFSGFLLQSTYPGTIIG